jgi:hypothetical protein
VFEIEGNPLHLHPVAHKLSAFPFCPEQWNTGCGYRQEKADQDNMGHREAPASDPLGSFAFDILALF